MGDQFRWRPQEVVELAEQLSRIGESFANEIAYIYNTFDNLGKNQLWVGANYNTIAEIIFNPSRGKFEEWAEILQVQIPQIIYGIAETQIDDEEEGCISMSINTDVADIRPIDETEQKADGSMILDPTEVRATMQNLNENYEIMNSRLSEYYSQVEQFETLDGNDAISDVYSELDEIIPMVKGITESFKNDSSDAVEKSIAKVEFTNEEARNMARQLEQIING